MKLQPCGKYKYKKAGLPKMTTEHRAIMHEIDPRPNEANLVIHHIDGNKSNNSPDNLMWMTRSEHAKLHHSGENHFPCGGELNANYKHGMCVNGHSKKYKHITNKASYQKHREERLAKQNAYCILHREHKRWYDKVRYWEKEYSCAKTDERKLICLEKLKYLKEHEK